MNFSMQNVPVEEINEIVKARQQRAQLSTMIFIWNVKISEITK